MTGKLAIVTGASSGIGRATAKMLAEAGVRVVAAARRDDKLRELVRECPPGSVAAVPADVSKTEDIDVVISRAMELGQERLDIVVVSAGQGLGGGVVSSDQARWEEMVQLNVIGASHLMRRAAEIMVPQKAGDIVVLGAATAVNLAPFSGYYGATKSAIGAMAESLRREVCQHKVRVSVVKPATVISGFHQMAGYTEDGLFKMAARWGQLLQPEDVARAIVFMVSQPAYVHINDLMIRPVGQDYP